MTNRRLAIPLVLLLLPVLLPAQMSNNEAIALEYARQSLSLLQEGLPDEAFLLAGRGLGFDETSSDLHYLRAVSGAHRKERTLSARSHLESAIALDSWRLVDLQDGVRSLLSVLMRIGDYEAARDLLPLLRLQRPVDYRISAQVLRVAGEFSEADDIFARGRRLYPDDAGLFRFGLSLDTVPEPAERRWLDRHASRGQDYLAALLDFILLTSSISERRELLDRYFEHGGEHPMAYAAAVEWDLEGFIDAEAYRDRSALQLAMATVRGTPGEDVLREALGGFSGTIVEDSNRDSFSESRMEIRDGSLESWEVDRDTDGLVEWRIHFESGVPVRGERRAEETSYRVGFYDYPEVAAVTFLSLPGEPTYHLLPRAVDSVIVPPEQVRGAGTLELVTSLRIADRPDLLSPAPVARSAYVVDFFDDGGDQVARVVVDGSGPVRRFEDSTGDGRIDRVLDYEDEMVVAGVRDPDGDGYFEVTEQYIGGELALLLVDEDDDFSIEYTEAPGSALLNTPAVYSWDLDGDGLVDIQEIIRQQDLILGDFSSSAPGVFDVTFEEVLRVFTP